MLKFSLSNILRHKLRSALSILGIVLGVASLIVLVSLVDGIKYDIEDAIGSAQGVRVSPLVSSDPVLNFLDESWVSKIEKVQGVSKAIPIVMQIPKTIEGKSIDYGGVRLVGLDLTKASSTTEAGYDGELLEGRDFTSSDAGQKVVLLSKKVKEDYDKFVGSKIKINEEPLRVIGIYTTGSELTDTSILAPIETVRDITGYPSDKVSAISVRLNNPVNDTIVAKRINLLYGDDVKASSMSDFSSQFGTIFASVTALVAAIASIASLVAAVGIINTMLMSVLERFKEIGALKAVGWANSNIMRMIVYESAFIGLIGGFLGILLGVGLANAVTLFGFTIVLTPTLLFGSFFGAVFVGIIAGVYPAFIASKMDPIEALRAE